MNHAVFLDKDGTLLENIPYNVDPSRITFIAGVTEGLNVLKRMGYLLILISNQSGLAKGYFDEKALHIKLDALQTALTRERAGLDGMYYCPHHPDGTFEKYSMVCSCRKPRPGMLYRAAAEHDIDLSASWMIGDTLSDIEAGHRAGCKTILLSCPNTLHGASGATAEVTTFQDAVAAIRTSKI
ncbi:D,D-heptose 1,7-bisphosphate phosphatase [Chryseolinea serpens]|uniref:D,D-heptose 1,7-bisphosphate phosphatase n=1 Tax=Chryseolinea serpens TaxID=947013 RepID=A0A1M5XU27_9BACT|nr:HAD family hydrolase [Chryseolinea serpens]SHI03325.1 D,D-heptose 1,7-bisphosphate phosphatase [Chryseolinea serpens]